jgi:hypothetical protein
VTVCAAALIGIILASAAFVKAMRNGKRGGPGGPDGARK